MILDAEKPSLALYQHVRAGALMQGMSFTQLARSTGYATNAAKMALCGTWNGDKGKAARRRLVGTVQAMLGKANKS